MSNITPSKYTAHVNRKGRCQIIETESGHIMATAKTIKDLEWIVDELNSLTWAVSHLLSVLEEQRLLNRGTDRIDPGRKAPSRQAEGPQKPGTNSPQPVRPT